MAVALNTALPVGLRSLASHTGTQINHYLPPYWDFYEKDVPLIE